MLAVGGAPAGLYETGQAQCREKCVTRDGWHRIRPTSRTGRPNSCVTRPVGARGYERGDYEVAFFRMHPLWIAVSTLAVPRYREFRDEEGIL